MCQLLASGVDMGPDTGRVKSKRIGRCQRTLKVSDPIVIHSIDGLLTTLLLVVDAALGNLPTPLRQAEIIAALSFLSQQNLEASEAMDGVDMP